jgi:predicted CoA-binding protein
MECEFPTINSNKEEIREIFTKVKTIAVLGLSPDESKASHRVAKYLKEVGYKIVPVYPKYEEILGEKVYRSLAEIPFEVDMVDIFRKPAAFDAVAEACIKRGDVKVFWGQQGSVNNAAAEKAKNAGMTVVQNLCAMVAHRDMV